MDVSCSFKLLYINKQPCQCIQSNNLTHEQGEPFQSCVSTIALYN